MPTQNQRHFTWLHLSDLHQGQGSQDWLWPTLKQEFYKDLERVFRRTGPWDLVLFTGDLTQKASSSEFDSLSKVLEDLWTLFQNWRFCPKLAIVPGNHDLLRPDRRDPIVKALQLWHTDSDVRHDFWAHPTSAYRKLITTCFSNYTNWIRTLQIPCVVPAETPGLPGEFATTVTGQHDIPIGIVGLNSTFLQITDNEYEGLLDLSEQQIHSVCGGDAAAWCAQHPINFLITHHPPSWLEPSAQKTYRAEINPPGRFFAHIYGHLHDSASRTLREGGASPRREWQGRSLFGLKTWQSRRGGSDRLHGYSVGRIDWDGEPLLRQWPRHAIIGHAGQWRMVPDHGFELDENEATKEFCTLNISAPKLTSEHSEIIPNSRPDIAEAKWKKGSISEPSKAAAQSNSLLGPIRTETSSIELTSTSTQTQTNLVEGSLTEQQALDRLKMVQRWNIKHASHHLAVRQVEQQLFVTALDASRVIWLIADWGMGKEGFLSSTISNEKPGTQWVPNIIRINCENLTSMHELQAEAERQLGISLQELGICLAALPQSYLIFDNIPVFDERESDIVDRFEPIIEIIQAFLDYSASTRLVLISRKAPMRSKFRAITLKALDEPDCARYIAAHPEGGGALAVRDVERLHDRSEGVPMHLDSLIRALQTTSLDELSRDEVDPKEFRNPATETPPKALVQAIASLKSSREKYTRRTFRLLRILTMLSYGETFEAIHKFDPTEPLYRDNIDQLRSLGLLEVVPLLSHIDGLGPAEATAPKLLVVPRQVKDYVRALLHIDDQENILKQAMEHYFGSKWREGKISAFCGSVSGKEDLSHRTGNALIALSHLIKQEARIENNNLLSRILPIAESFVQSLVTAHRYREACNAAEELLQVLAHCGMPSAALVRIQANRGFTLRMLGSLEEAVTALEAALSSAEPNTSHIWKGWVYLEIANAQQQIDDRQAAIAAAQKALEIIDSDSPNACQSQAIIIGCDDSLPDNEKLRRLSELETKSRKKGYDIVANNIALQLAAMTAAPAERKLLQDRVINTPDTYNRIRATLLKAQDLINQGNSSAISASERRSLSQMYTYLFIQRMHSLFELCTDVLWRLTMTEKRVPILLRMFRHSSFFWRIYGKADSERKYLDDLKRVYPPTSGTDGSELSEFAYYLTRQRALEPQLK